LVGEGAKMHKEFELTICSSIVVTAEVFDARDDAKNY